MHAKNNTSLSSAALSNSAGDERIVMALPLSLWIILKYWAYEICKGENLWNTYKQEQTPQPTQRAHSEYFSEEYLRDRINPNSRYSFHRSIQRYLLPLAIKADVNRISSTGL